MRGDPPASEREMRQVGLVYEVDLAHLLEGREEKEHCIALADWVMNYMALYSITEHSRAQHRYPKFITNNHIK